LLEPEANNRNAGFILSSLPPNNYEFAIGPENSSIFNPSFYTTSMADVSEMDLDVIEVPIEDPVINREE